jgi:RNA polymerase sigma factor (sigma-70 family)
VEETTLNSLVFAAKQGDLDAFESIVIRVQDMAYGLAYARLGDYHLARDAAQMAFISAWTQLGSLKNEGSFLGWFRRIVITQCNRLTRRKHIRETTLDEAHSVCSSEPDPQIVAEDKELRGIVSQAISALPEHQRIVITLFHIQDLSAKEVALFLELPLTTVKKRLHDARRRLRQEVISMTKDELSEQRPSKSKDFAKKVVEILDAARTGNSSRIDQLLSEDSSLIGAHEDPEQGHDDVTPLHYAVSSDDTQIIDTLLKRGADIDAVESSHGLTPLGFAAVFPNQRRDIAMYLIKRGAKVDIFSASALGLNKEVEKLVNQDPELIHTRLSKADWRMQPLHVAAWRGHIDVVKALLDHGADPHATDDIGTPLDRAKENEHSEVIELLRSFTA